jgi:hypothetical protein
MSVDWVWVGGVIAFWLLFPLMFMACLYLVGWNLDRRERRAEGSLPRLEVEALDLEAARVRRRARRGMGRAS